MTAAAVVVRVDGVMTAPNPLPPAVARKISAFLKAGHTGRIVLHVKCGEVRSFELAEVGDARAPVDESLEYLPSSER